MVRWLYSLITNVDVSIDEYIRKINDTKSPITRNVLSNVSFVCSGSVMLSTKDTVINNIQKATAKIEAMQADIDVMKSVIREHSEKLQKIS